MKYLLPFLLIIGCFVACENENEEDLFPPISLNKDPNIDTTSGLSVSFSNDIQPLIRTNCATPGCHVANMQSPTLQTYTQIEASKSIIKLRVDQGTMPPSGPLAQSDKDKISTWIAEGAKNN